MSTIAQDVRLRNVARNSFSRSPQPYHRRSISLKNDVETSSSTEGPLNDVTRSSDSSEDHAIEADDEKGPLLRLAAPPLRARKGLRGGEDLSLQWTPAISPIPTPPIRNGGFVFAEKEDTAEVEQAKQKKDELYAKYLRRRQTEIVRRVTETLLLVAIGSLCVLDCKPTPQGLSFSISPGLLKWNFELSCFLIVIFSCYLLYPVRRALRLRTSNVDVVLAVRKGFHVPSRFDPGILLYPVLLPLFIAASVDDRSSTILVNIVLGLASMPKGVIPVPGYGVYYMHWVLSMLSVSLHIPFKIQPTLLKLCAPTTYVGFQEMSLLFPLHQNLVEVISNLVTTSLDPSETQLLSAGLINILVFASTPQSQILKALLLLGGLSLFVFCEFALKAEVALARIPVWRFARNKTSTKGLSGRLNRMLRALLPEHRSRFAVSASSDSEDEVSEKLQPLLRSRKKQSPSSKNEANNRSSQKTLSADENEGNGYTGLSATFPSLVRSSTFSSFGSAATMAVRWKNIAVSPNPYARLNFLHAQALKILLALYVYVATALVILLPVRIFITQRALHGNEAVGWAIGYFVGDVPQVRMFVIGNNLDWWIKIPQNKSQIRLVDGAGRVETYQRQVLGSANTRLVLAAYCVVMVSIGIAAVLRLQKVVEVDTRRKVFHGVMVLMLLPTIPIDPCFFALALTIVLAVFLMLDLFRAAQLPPISRPLTNFLAPYVDGRDHRGPVIVSHMFLLIGCAIPLWLSLADMKRMGDGAWEGWEVASRDLSMVSGVICVGMGDAAASLIGRRYGKTKWYWGGGKSIEGSVAFAVAVMIGLTASWLWLRVGGWVDFRVDELPVAMFKALMAGTGASVMESTLTAANDNVVVPIGLWLLVRGLRV